MHDKREGLVRSLNYSHVRLRPAVLLLERFGHRRLNDGNAETPSSCADRYPVKKRGHFGLLVGWSFALVESVPASGKVCQIAGCDSLQQLRGCAVLSVLLPGCRVALVV